MKITKKIARDTDVGTSERAQQQGGVYIAPRQITEGGFAVVHGAQARIECVIDALREQHLLDGSEGAKADRVAVGRSRYQQALWLRELFMEAGLNPVHALDLNARGGQGDIPDAVAKARSLYNRTIRSLGAYGETVACFVCFDQFPKGEAGLNGLRKGLDRLCQARGA
jgi:hypothetical protein